MHCVKAIKHFWKGIASIILLWLQEKKRWRKNIIKLQNDVIIKCVHLYLILAVNRTIHQSNFGESHPWQVGFLSPVLKRSQAARIIFKSIDLQVCISSNVEKRREREKKNLHAQKRYTCFIADFLLRLATYKLMYYCHPFAEPWLCWHRPNTMWISAKRLCFVIRLFGSFFLFLFSSSSTLLCWAWIPNANYNICVLCVEKHKQNSKIRFNIFLK